MTHKIYLFTLTLILMLLLGSFYQTSAQISGKVVDVDGNAVSGIIVELISTEFQSRPIHNEIYDDVTDDDGSFTFEDIPNGKYVAAIGYVWTPSIDDPYPTTFYPNGSEKSGALIFEITDESKPQNILFQLPEKLPELTIRGKILAANGKPAVNAHVRLHNEESKLVVSDCRTDENGNFFLKGFVGGQYHIEADTYKMSLDDWDVASSKIFTLNRKMKGFRLTLASYKSKSTNKK